MSAIRVSTLLLHAGWHILSIEVNMPLHGKNYKFKADAWLARDKGEGGLTARTFTVDPAQCEVTTFKPRVLLNFCSCLLLLLYTVHTVYV